MTRILRTLPVLLLLAVLASPAAGAQTSIVRSVLFYSPTCGHCHEVINNQLPGIFDQFGGPPTVIFDENLAPEDLAFHEVGNGTVQMLFVDVSIEAGAELYEAATAGFDIPESMSGVPRLVVGDEFYVGSASIPAEFPRIIEAGLEAGGIDWPDIDGLGSALEAVPGLSAAATTTTTEPAVSTTEATTTTTEATSTAQAPDESVPTPAEILEGEGGEVTIAEDGESIFRTGSQDSVWEKFTRDTVANTVAVAVLLGMIISLAAAAGLWRRVEIGEGRSWAVPVIALLGVGVATYLTYIETSGSHAVCGPVGNCNAVQQSKYAELFGFLPVGVVGLIGYAVVVGAWAVTRLAKGRLADWGSLALLAGTVTGLAFSIYLTFLEPFVIGASCAWCLASAIIVTLLFWLSLGPAQSAWRRLRPSAASA